MKIKIKPNAGTIYIRNYLKDRPPNASMPPTVREHSDKITAIQGMTIDIETKYLWDNQLNTAPIPGISKLGLRILDFPEDESIIEKIIDDERPNRMQCVYCDHYLQIGAGMKDECWYCGEEII